MKKEEFPIEFIIDFFVRPIIKFLTKLPDNKNSNCEFKTTIGKIKL